MLDNALNKAVSNSRLCRGCAFQWRHLGESASPGKSQEVIHYIIDSKPVSHPLSENIMLSTKLQVHNILHCRLEDD